MLFRPSPEGFHENWLLIWARRRVSRRTLDHLPVRVGTGSPRWAVAVVCATAGARGDGRCDGCCFRNSPARSLFLVIGVHVLLRWSSRSSSPGRARRSPLSRGPVPVLLAFLVGMLQTEARAGRDGGPRGGAPAGSRTPRRLGALLSRRRWATPRFELVYWLPGFETLRRHPRQAGPAAGGGARAAPPRRSTAGTSTSPRSSTTLRSPTSRVLLEVVCAATDVALERERLQTELAFAASEELAGFARCASSRPATRRGGGSSATCTTAPSSASSRSRSRCV